MKPTSLEFFDIFIWKYAKSKEEGKNQESKRSSTTFSDKAFSQNDSWHRFPKLIDELRKRDIL